MHSSTAEIQRVVWVLELLVHAVTSVPAHRHVQDSHLRDLRMDSISRLKPSVPVLSCRSRRRSREEDVAGLKGNEVANGAQLFVDLVDHLAGRRIHHLFVVHVQLDAKVIRIFDELCRCDCGPHGAIVSCPLPRTRSTLRSLSTQMRSRQVRSRPIA